MREAPRQHWTAVLGLVYDPQSLYHPDWIETVKCAKRISKVLVRKTSDDAPYRGCPLVAVTNSVSHPPAQEFPLKLVRAMLRMKTWYSLPLVPNPKLAPVEINRCFVPYDMAD